MYTHLKETGFEGRTIDPQHVSKPGKKIPAEVCQVHLYVDGLSVGNCAHELLHALCAWKRRRGLIIPHPLPTSASVHPIEERCAYALDYLTTQFYSHLQRNHLL